MKSDLKNLTSSKLDNKMTVPHTYGVNSLISKYNVFLSNFTFLQGMVIIAQYINVIREIYSPPWITPTGVIVTCILETPEQL